MFAKIVPYLLAGALGIGLMSPSVAAVTPDQRDGVKVVVDEVSLGLAPLIVKAIFDILVQLNKDEGLTLLIVEQDALRRAVEVIELALRDHPRRRAVHQRDVDILGRRLAIGDHVQCLAP